MPKIQHFFSRLTGTISKIGDAYHKAWSEWENSPRYKKGQERARAEGDAMAPVGKKKTYSRMQK